MRDNHYTMLARAALKKSLSNVPDDANVAVGCSGGADSLALLAGLSTLYKNGRSQQVHVVVINHQLQEVTAEVAQSTASLAESLGFTAHVKNVTVDTGAGGVEQNARNARYDAFQEVIEEFNVQAFFLGHTMNDQAEQVLLGLLRGSGTTSISGMREVRDVYHRPFLNSLSREDTEKVCEENGFDYWSDPHNEDTVYRRVSVRKFLKDLNKTLDADFVPALVKTARIASEDDEALAFYAGKHFDVFEKTGWNVSELLELPKAVRSRLFKMKISSLISSTSVVTFKDVERVEALVSSWAGQGEVCFSGSVRVFRKKNEIFFKRI